MILMILHIFDGKFIDLMTYTVSQVYVLIPLVMSLFSHDLH